jgi:putative hydrolase of the HAD superfamily
MPKRCIDNDGYQRLRMIATVRSNGFIELVKAGQGSTFSGQIRAVDDDVLRHTTVSQASIERRAYDCPMFTTVFWDFGGVILSSPFDAFREYETFKGLPLDFIRSVNTHNPDTNAWARLERTELSPEEFDLEFAVESGALGHRVPGRDVLSLLSGQIRPSMVAALDTVINAGFRTACLTNNVLTEPINADPGRDAEIALVMARFEIVVESSKVGSRKPEPLFYETACKLMAVQPTECIFLDDLGVNLKPAAAMGMHTIKVVDPNVALAELAAITGLHFG